MSIFYLIVSAVGLADLAWWRWAHRRLHAYKRARLWQAVVAVFVLGQFLYLGWFIVAPRSARRVHGWLPMPLVASAYIWHLLALPAAWLGIGTAAALQAGDRLVRRPRSVARSGQPTLTRRQALAAAVAAPPLLTAIGTLRALPQLDEFRISRLCLPIPNLPPNLQGLRIAHLSDIHVGKFTRAGSLQRIVEATNRLRADLVLFTGDLIDLSLADLPAGIDAIKQLDPRHGFAMIEGNHDLIENPDAFETRTRAAGLPLLLDEAMTFSLRNERVQILGTRWGAATGDRRRAGDAAFRASVGRLAPQREPGTFPILLAHHPHTFDPAAAAGFPLTLSGHTHGGQLMLTRTIGCGPLFFRYWSGRYAHGSSQMIVNNGVGNWFPLRVNAPAEIVELTLVRT